MVEPIAKLFKDGSRYALHYPDYDIWIRGPYVEWVLLAGAEMIMRIERLKLEGSIDELELTREFQDPESIDTQIDSLRYAQNKRFEVIPQCTVTMQGTDYRWVSRNDSSDHGSMERLVDTSLTRNNTFLSGSPPRLS
jgi:hypothetical protein